MCPVQKKETGDILKVIVDRIEKDILVVELEDMSFANMPQVLAPDAKEGDVINIEKDICETKKRQKVIAEKFNKLINKQRDIL